jgi:glycosyltransferase involved in cell wall biosynthesis
LDAYRRRAGQALARLHWPGTPAERRAALEEVLAAEQAAGPTFIFAPGLDWDVQLFQRPQQLALALARSGALVLYSQPTPQRGKALFRRAEPHLYLGNVPPSALAHLPGAYVYVLTWNGDQARRLPLAAVVYDFVDEVDVFYGNQRKIRALHEQLLGSARLVLATAQGLYEQARAVRPDALLCPNGVDYDFFARARERSAGDPPADLAPILALGKPLIGYYGALARWFDFDLLAGVASLRPRYEFVLIGPDYDGTLEPRLRGLGTNVHWLGPKPYQALPDYLRAFAVATIPFQVNAITHATSPLKLFEYMAAGKPVVITPMRESLRYPGVLAGADAPSFAAQLDRALELRSDAAYLETIDRVARENTWEARARQILAALSSPPGQTPTGADSPGGWA